MCLKYTKKKNQQEINYNIGDNISDDRKLVESFWKGKKEKKKRTQTRQTKQTLKLEPVFSVQGCVTKAYEKIN